MVKIKVEKIGNPIKINANKMKQRKLKMIIITSSYSTSYRCITVLVRQFLKIYFHLRISFPKPFYEQKGFIKYETTIIWLNPGIQMSEVPYV